MAFSRLRGEVWRARRPLLDFHEKDGTEPLGGFSVEPKRTENPIGEMSHVVSDKCSWHARRQQSRRHGDRSRRVAGSPLRFQDRRRNLLLLHSFRAQLDSGHRIAELVARAAHPFLVDGVRPGRAEGSGFGDSQEEVAPAACLSESGDAPHAAAAGNT